MLSSSEGVTYEHPHLQIDVALLRQIEQPTIVAYILTSTAELFPRTISKTIYSAATCKPCVEKIVWTVFTYEFVMLEMEQK